MNVDVDLGGIDAHVEHRQRETIGFAQPAICLFHREGQVAVVDATAIHEDHDMLAAGPVQGRRTDQTAHHPLVDGEHGRRGRRIVDGGKSHAPVTIAGGLQHPATIDVERDPDRAVRQGQFAHQPHDDRGFGRGLFEEFEPCRGVEEQPAHADTRPHRTPGRTCGDLLATFDQHPVPLSPIAWPAYRFHPRDRGNARQCLAPESERANRSEVLERADLAGGVPPKGERQVDRGHSHPVVDDLDEALAGGLDRNLDPRGAGIDRVLHEFLDNGRGSINDLPGRDAVGDRRRQDGDARRFKASLSA